MNPALEVPGCENAECPSETKERLRALLLRLRSRHSALLKPWSSRPGSSEVSINEPPEDEMPEGEPEERRVILLLNSSKRSKAKFRREAFGGGMRWLASVLALVSMGLVVDAALHPAQAVMYFPFQARGLGVFWFAVTCSIFYLLLAVVNWRAWLRRNNP